MTTQVLTQEELQSIKEVQNKRRDLMEQFGVIELAIQELEIQKQELRTELQTLKLKEIEVGSTLQNKYGEGTINVEKGEFISSN
jgi:hypothetical protein